MNKMEVLGLAALVLVQIAVTKVLCWWAQIPNARVIRQ
jgi:hypothetical protein